MCTSLVALGALRASATTQSTQRRSQLQQRRGKTGEARTEEEARRRDNIPARDMSAAGPHTQARRNSADCLTQTGWDSQGRRAKAVRLSRAYHCSVLEAPLAVFLASPPLPAAVSVTPAP